MQFATKQELIEEITKLRIEEAEREASLLRWMFFLFIAAVFSCSCIALAAIELLTR